MAKQTENGESQTGTGAGEGPARKGGGGRAQQRSSSSRARSSPRRAKNAVALQKHLKGEHAQLDALFQHFDSADESGKEQALRELAQELIIQMTVKEQVLYPALQEAKVEEALINEALVSYDVAKLLLRDIIGGRTDDRFRDAKVAMLAQTVEHHVAKEEQPRQGLLAKAAGIDDAVVVSHMQERRKALEADSESGMPDLVPVVTFNRQPGYTRRPGEDSTMPQNGPDRDEHGRFMSHDDHRGGRGYGGGGGGRGRMDDDDDRGRGMHSRGGRSYEDDDNHRDRGYGGGGGRGYGGGGGREHGQGGWFGDSEGHSQASRMGWDERRREGSGRGESGWFGDREGHSEASRRGWESRYREGTEHDSGWHGDPQGHSEASRRGWDTRRREGTEHDSGWHGDPQGHSRASQMGWETRRREGNDRYDDDHRGRSGGGYGGGGRGSYESEGRSRSMSGGGYENRGGGRGYGGDQGQGQGGWFGDSEGHSEASRRGWENRRHDDDDRGGRGRR